MMIKNQAKALRHIHCRKKPEGFPDEVPGDEASVRLIDR